MDAIPRLSPGPRYDPGRGVTEVRLPAAAEPANDRTGVLLPAAVATAALVLLLVLATRWRHRRT